MFKRRLVTVLGLIVCSSFVSNHCVVPIASAQGESAVRPRQASAPPSAETTVTIGEQFPNSFLDAVFINLKPPAFPISIASVDVKSNSPDIAASHASSNQDSCASVIVLEREMSGVKTIVRFENGRIIAPLAFSGSYNAALLGCLRFQGWADTVINLEFDRARQLLSARVSIRNVQLDGVPPLANNVVVNLVQDAIDKRINPIKILEAEQLSARVPVAASGGALRLRAKEVRPEIVPGTLRLHILYEFVPAK